MRALSCLVYVCRCIHNVNFIVWYLFIYVSFKGVLMSLGSIVSAQDFVIFPNLLHIFLRFSLYCILRDFLQNILIYFVFCTEF
jgi:hypothetical protein